MVETPASDDITCIIEPATTAAVGSSARHVRQNDLDRWLSEQNTQRRHLVRYFLKWTHQRGLSRKLVVPTIPRHQPAKLLDDDERWRLLQRCLTDTALPVDVRAAGALTLLFGLPTERIRHLTADQLSCQGKHTYLTAGRRPALLSPRLPTSSKTWPQSPSRNVASQSTPTAARHNGCSRASCRASQSPTMP